MAHWLARLVKHRLLDEGDARRLLGAEGLARIEARVKESEARHSGEIRVMVEAGLPTSYLRRGASARDRATAMFGKLAVWDTERNNGVLLYVLIAEHAIEIVADRGVARVVDAGEWHAIAAAMTGAFRSRDFEGGVLRAVDAVDALLVRHFPRRPGDADVNELPDAPVVR